MPDAPAPMTARYERPPLGAAAQRDGRRRGRGGRAAPRAHRRRRAAGGRGGLDRRAPERRLRRPRLGDALPPARGGGRRLRHAPRRAPAHEGGAAPRAPGAPPADPRPRREPRHRRRAHRGAGDRDRPGPLGDHDPVRAPLPRPGAARSGGVGGAAPRARRRRRDAGAPARLERVRAGALGRRAARVRGHPRAALGPARRVRHPHRAELLRHPLADDRPARGLGPGPGAQLRLPPPHPAGPPARRASAAVAAEDAGPPRDPRAAVRDLPRRLDRADPSRPGEDDALHGEHDRHGPVDAPGTRSTCRSSPRSSRGPSPRP